jgi:hypothetical protein
MNPSEVDKGNQDEKKDRADSDKTRLVPADLEIPEGDEEEQKNLTWQPRRFFLADEDARFSIAAIITV